MDGVRGSGELWIWRKKRFGKQMFADAFRLGEAMRENAGTSAEREELLKAKVRRELRIVVYELVTDEPFFRGARPVLLIRAVQFVDGAKHAGEGEKADAEMGVHTYVVVDGMVENIVQATRLAEPWFQKRNVARTQHAVRRIRFKVMDQVDFGRPLDAIVAEQPLQPI